LREHHVFSLPGGLICAGMAEIVARRLHASSLMKGMLPGE
jgi:hypothetical protein